NNSSPGTRVAIFIDMSPKADSCKLELRATRLDHVASFSADASTTLCHLVQHFHIRGPPGWRNVEQLVTARVGVVFELGVVLHHVTQGLLTLAVAIGTDRGSLELHRHLGTIRCRVIFRDLADEMPMVVTRGDHHVAQPMFPYRFDEAFAGRTIAIPQICRKLG